MSRKLSLTGIFLNRKTQFLYEHTFIVQQIQNITSASNLQNIQSKHVCYLVIGIFCLKNAIMAQSTGHKEGNILFHHCLSITVLTVIISLLLLSIKGRLLTLLQQFPEFSAINELQMVG